MELANQTQMKNFFDELAKTWDSRQKEISPRDELIKSLPIDNNDLVLDLACGTGIVSNLIYQKTNRQVIGLDISSEMISRAKAKYSEDIAKYFVGDFYDFKYEESFNAIVVFDAFPHFTDKNKFIASCRNNLKDKGYLCILHDLGREELAHHHAGRVMQYSLDLLSPLEEYEYFKEEYDLIASYEDETRYLLIMRKK
jgi:demethylmenaquinone methyltransferase/2-methoxy-6-polyprenyl-1,4-benzoquinol methylase